jgi:hypothetical protein
MPVTPVPRTAPSGIHKSALDLALEENQRLRARLQTVPDSAPRSLAARAMSTRGGQLGTLTGALVLIIGAVSPFAIAWMDVPKLRAEIAEQKLTIAALEARVGAAETWTRDTLGPWRGAVDAYRTEQDRRDAWRDRVLCRTGNKPAWEMSWTCPVPKGWAALRE